MVPMSMGCGGVEERLSKSKAHMPRSPTRTPLYMMLPLSQDDIGGIRQAMLLAQPHTPHNNSPPPLPHHNPQLQTCLAEANVQAAGARGHRRVRDTQQQQQQPPSCLTIIIIPN